MRPALALSLVVALAGAPLASAAPAAGTETGSSASVLRKAAGTTYQLDLLASAPSEGPPRLRVRLVTTNSSEPRHLYGELPASALTTAGDTTTLRAQIGGVPLKVVWRTTTATYTVSVGRHDSHDTTDAEGWTIVGYGGTASVTLGSARCTADLVATGPVAAYDTAGYGAPLSKGLGMSLKGASCSALPTSSFPPPLPTRAV